MSQRSTGDMHCCRTILFRDCLSSTLHRVLVEQLLAVDDFLIFKAWQHHAPSHSIRLSDSWNVAAVIAVKAYATTM